MSEYHSSFQGSVYIICVDFHSRWDAHCSCQADPRDIFPFPVHPQRPPQAGSMALRELCFASFRSCILTHKHFQASLQPWECGNEWPAGACRKLNSCPSHAIPLVGCQVHVFSIPLAKKFSQPSPPFHWTPPTPPNCFLFISFNVLRYSASSKLFLEKTNNKKKVKFQPSIHVLSIFIIPPNIPRVVFRLGYFSSRVYFPFLLFVSTE